jgi:hypothetical protein
MKLNRRLIFSPFPIRILIRWVRNSETVLDVLAIFSVFVCRCKGIEHFLLELKDQLPDVEFVLNTRDWPQASLEYSFFRVS